MWEQAEIDYVAGMKYKDIAAKYGVSINTVKSWQRRHNWERGKPKTSKSKKRTKCAKNVHTKKCTPDPEREAEGQEEKKKIIQALVKFDEINERQRLFCLYYMQTHNATSSYQRAYACTRAAAGVSAHALLKNPKIHMAIQKMQDERDAGILLRGTDIVELYMRIAFADMSEFVSVKGGEMYLQDMEDVDGQLIKSVSPTKGGGIKIELADRMKALQWLSDYFELNPRDRHKAAYQSKMVELRERELEAKEDGW